MPNLSPAGVTSAQPQESLNVPLLTREKQIANPALAGEISQTSRALYTISA